MYAKADDKQNRLAITGIVGIRNQLDLWSRK